MYCILVREDFYLEFVMYFIFIIEKCLSQFVMYYFASKRLVNCHQRTDRTKQAISIPKRRLDSSSSY